MITNSLKLAAAACAAVLLSACASKPTTPPAPTEPQLAPAQRAQIQQPQITPRQRAETHADLAVGYYERGQMDVALEELGVAAQLDPSLPRIYTTYGLVHLFLGEIAKAESSFRQALSLAPADPEVRSSWGVYLCGTGRYAEAVGEFDAALRNPMLKGREATLINAGKCSAAAGKKAEAVMYLRLLLELNAQNSQAAYNLALIDYREGRYESARKLLPVALGDGESSPPALYLGHCVEQRAGNAPLAHTYATQLRSRFPESPEAAALKQACP